MLHTQLAYQRKTSIQLFDTMKIGTLTFHRANNFGGALQCFSLIYYLRKNGYDAEVADYRSKAIESAYKLIRFSSLRAFVGSLRELPMRLRHNENFKEFRKLIPISANTFCSAKELDGVYDIVLIGSDQVWSKRINQGFDPVFWGNIKGGTKVVSYAASMGTDHNYTDEENQIIREYLNNFDAISVREDSLNTEMSALTEKPIQTVVDPTLLLDKSDYSKIESMSIVPSNKYVLYYQMEYHEKSRLRVQEVAEQLNCDVIVIGGRKEHYEGKYKHYAYSDITVPEFIGLINNATCVFASSFHGTALSVAMRKDFYFFDNYESDRAENLLLHIGAHDRMIKSTNSLKYTPVKYSVIENNIKSYILKSTEFLKNNLNNSI